LGVLMTPNYSPDAQRKRQNDLLDVLICGIIVSPTEIKAILMGANSPQHVAGPVLVTQNFRWINSSPTRNDKVETLKRYGSIFPQYDSCRLSSSSSVSTRCRNSGRTANAGPGGPIRFLPESGSDPDSSSQKLGARNSEPRSTCGTRRGSRPIRWAHVASAATESSLRTIFPNARRSLKRAVAFHRDDNIRYHEMHGNLGVNVENTRECRAN
jgi:hypothetical protein